MTGHIHARGVPEAEDGSAIGADDLAVVEGGRGRLGEGGLGIEELDGVAGLEGMPIEHPKFIAFQIARIRIRLAEGVAGLPGNAGRTVEILGRQPSFAS